MSHSSANPPGKRPRFLSEADCRDIGDRLVRFAKGGGHTAVCITSAWTGNVRWARNQISTAGEVSDNWIDVCRNVNGAAAFMRINETSDAALLAAARQAERLVMLLSEKSDSDLAGHRPLELVSPQETPQLFNEATYQLDANQRASAAIALAQRAASAKMLSAGYIEVSAHSMACIDTFGRLLYYPYTQAQYSVTVRDPKGTGSGWAGVDHTDWSKIDAEKITATALDKCLRSQNPVRIEPGRYTAILEPQAVCDLIGNFVAPNEEALDFSTNLYPTTRGIGPFNKTIQAPSYTRLGERIVDERITISADPMDPELGFPPYFGGMGWRNPDLFSIDTSHKVAWIDRGVLTHLAYNRNQAIEIFGSNTGLPNSGAFRMSGGTTSLDEMIATTKRGVLVTRFSQITELDFRSQLYRGYTRDGLWLVENGKISKAVKNLVFTESPLFALNNIEQLGVPQRVFHPMGTGIYTRPQPVIVPALKVRDFSFTALTDAV